MAVCFESYKDTRKLVFAVNVNDNTVEVSPEPIIYFVTPTYPRREQIAEITRLGQTLMHIPNLHWIVADDTENCNRFLNNLLKKFGKSLVESVYSNNQKYNWEIFISRHPLHAHCQPDAGILSHEKACSPWSR